MKGFSLISFFVLAALLSGCRALCESKARQERRHAEEIGVVLRRVDSLSSTLSERQHLKIEFYNPYGLVNPTDSTASLQQNSEMASGLGGLGPVKSIEITTETEASTHSNALTDSTAVLKTADDETRQTEKASEARQDKGTVATVAIVAGVVLLIYLLIKNYLK